MTLSFDPTLLPSPALLNSMRERQRAPARPVRAAQWYTPMLLFGAPGTPLAVPPEGLVVGRIPIIEQCQPIGWYLSSNVPATMSIHLDYAGPPADFPATVPELPEELQIVLADTPDYEANVTPLNAPALTATSRALYEQTPWIAGWPASFDRYAELRVVVDANDVAEQVLLVIYMLKVRTR